MTLEECKNLKPGDCFYIKHPRFDHLEGFYELTLPAIDDDNWQDNCKVIWQSVNPEKSENHLVGFKLTPTHHLLDYMKVIDPKDYPEYFI